MGDTADHSAAASALATRLGITAGQTVQEIGYDTDTDDLVADAVETSTGDPIVDEDFGGVVDVVLLWWRADDGDLGDALVDAMIPLADDGVMWLLTPKHGRSGALEPCRHRRCRVHLRHAAHHVGDARQLAGRPAGLAVASTGGPSRRPFAGRGSVLSTAGSFGGSG